ncbi:cell division septal protein FtsQ [Bradyrhizobium sp. USDA 4532]|nr:cell division septal protein FtsQ [Bradyrhizobium sp. USDA 4545]MCP1920424.1 cell division septal protein FtsQ [Bradyrhizobium sp. USDA 4532]
MGLAAPVSDTMMSLFSSESWSGTAVASGLGVLIVVALVFALVRYLEWSSNTNLTEFINRTEVAAATSTPILPLNRQTACEHGKKSPWVLSVPLE